MNSNNDYDVTIIGAGISGLTTAALLTKQGFKVIVIEQGETPGGLMAGIKKDGYFFNTGVNLFTGFQEKGAVNYLLKKIGLFTTRFKNNTLQKLDPGYQVVLPDRRINIYAKKSLLFDEFKREFPDHLATLQNFYTQADLLEKEIYSNHPERYPYLFFPKKQSGWTKKFSKNIFSYKGDSQTKDLFTTHKLHPALEKFFDIQTTYFGQKTFFESSILLSSLILNLPKRGIFYLKGGGETIVQMLAKFIQKQGGDIIYNACVEEILTKRKSVTGVQVTLNGVTIDIKSKCVVSSTGIFSQAALIKDKSSKHSFEKVTQGMKQKYIPFTVLLGVDEKVVPEPMKEHVFLVRDYDLPSHSDNFIFLSISRSSDTSRAPKGKRAISATIFLPPQKFSDDFYKRKTDTIISYLEQVLPFLPRYIDTVHTLCPKEYQRLTLREHGSFGIVKEKSTMDFCGVSPLIPIKRLLLIGDTSYPGHGVGCAVRSGLEAAQLISG